MSTYSKRKTGKEEGRKKGRKEGKEKGKGGKESICHEPRDLFIQQIENIIPHKIQILFSQAKGKTRSVSTLESGIT